MTNGAHTHCIRCHRPLRSDASQARGYGKTCARHIRQAFAGLDAWKPAQIDAAAELIEDGAILPVEPGLYEVVSNDGTTTHLTDGHTCTCPAGQNDRRCYHTAAAHALAA